MSLIGGFETMRNIVVVEAVSTGYNYIEDIYRRGYNPVEVQSKDDSPDLRECRKAGKNNRYRDIETIVETEDYQETLEKVRALDPVIVVPGAENGVALATHLAEDLGLPGNPVANLPFMTDKGSMHEALRKAGIRYIKGKIVKTPEEALAFCNENGFTSAVVKPVVSAASVGVFLCDNLEAVQEAVTKVEGMTTYFGHENANALVQERIRGTEYIVNIISSNGFHRLSSIFRYAKKQTAEGGNIYDCMESINRLEPGHTDLVDYAFKVADAIGFKYGEIHGEFMVDEKGPVLIEVNCRPMGGSMPGELLDQVMGQHETDSILDAFLDPEKFRRDALKPYRPKRKYALKFIMVPKDTDAEAHPLWEIARQLRSTYKVQASSEYANHVYHKTRDLDTAGGSIFMIHDDESVVMEDLHLLQFVEKDYFQLIINDGTSRRWFKEDGEAKIDYQAIIKRHGACGSILIAKDDDNGIVGSQVVTPDTLDDAHKGFEYCIIGYQKSLIERNEVDLLRLMFGTMDKVREGGKVIIPESVYKYLSYGKRGAELLLYIKRFLIEPPKPGNCGDVVGANEKI